MKKIITMMFFIATLSSMWGCKKSYEELNINPNSATDATIELLLTGAQVSSIVFYEGDIVRTAGIWSGSFTGADRQYDGLQNYATAAGDYDNAWSIAYRGVFGATKIIQRKAAAINNKMVVGIAQVMRAQVAGTAADLWGDVPFREAGDATAYPSPKYDPQTQVYADVQKLLDSAIANLTTGVGVNPGSKDIFYGGSTAKWIEAAYSLKARFFLHTKDYANAYANALLGISVKSGDMVAKHGNSYNQDFNLYYSFCVYDRDTYMSAENALSPRLLDNTSLKYRGDLNTNEKARYKFNYLKGDFYFGGYELNVTGGDFGSYSDNLGSGPSSAGAFGSDASYNILTYKETKLIEAEAAIRLASPNFTAALNALNSVRASNTSYLPSDYVSFFGAQYDPYLAIDFDPAGMQNPGTLSANTALLNEIVEERFVSFIGHFEQFNDIRRTKNSMGLPPNAGTQIPQRMLYPQSEANTNPNTPKQVQSDLFKPTPINL